MAQRKPQLTEQQHAAVTARGTSVALSAGAGCGKTFVLTERFLACLEPEDGRSDGVARLGQLVAITFTERAAREMRDRIRSACRTRLLDADGEQVGYWLNLLREMDSARISTIHAFCGSLLRAHAVEARLDPRFRVLDQAQAQTMLYRVLDEALRDRLAEGDDGAIDLVVLFGLDQLHQMIRTLLGRRQDIDWIAWQAETPEGLVARWEDYWRSEALPRALRQVAESPAARTVLEMARQDACSNAKMQRRFESLLEQFPGLCDAADPAGALASIRENAKVVGGGGKKAWADESTYERFKTAAEQLRKAVDRVARYTTFDAQAARSTAASALQLLDATAAVAGRYDRRKQELGVLDFDDLLIRARELLTAKEHEPVRRRLAAQIRLLLVDEFQDTDSLQVGLVEALCSDELTRGKLFFVGDYKQSIYRFRGAEPHVFERLCAKIPAAGRLPLSLNFRSQPAVLDFVNGLFCEDLGPQYESLLASRKQVSPRPSIEMIWATRSEPGPKENVDELRRREADWIARRIRTMLDRGEEIVWDEEAAKAGKPAARAVRPGDVALLFRALSNVDLYEEALRRYGIDYYLVGGRAFYAQQEIFDLVNLLRTLDTPGDEVSLVGVLRSPFFSLLDETLYWLAQHPDGLTGGLFADALPDELDTLQRERVAFAAATLRELRAIKDRLPIARLIDEALSRTGYDAVLLAEFLGERKLANLRKLVEGARSFDRSGIFTLSDFITQLSEFVARQPDESLAATSPESSDVVRLMTIHQSKGLEFPVTVIPDLDRSNRGSPLQVAFTSRLGPMVKDSDAIGGLELHKLVEEDEEQAELVRLLYVATTRAADYLILSAGLPKPGTFGSPWMGLIERRFGRDVLDVEPQDEAADTVVTVGDVPIRVTVAEPPLDSKPVASSRRRSLQKIVEKAREMADTGSGRLPQLIAPVPVDRSARRQYSFSRLSGMLHAQQAVTAVAAPLSDDLSEPPSPDPLGLGTLVHAVLAEVEFGQTVDVPALVRRHAPRHLPESTDQLDEATEMIARFLQSPRSQTMAAAEELHPELEFLLAWPPGGETGGSESACPYLQGFIDCIYRDTDDHWHIVDYKTNRTTQSTLASTAADYEMQMLLYALAAEQILGRPPASLTLCFLRSGLEHSFAWDTAARGRVVEMIDGALHKAATGGRAQ